MIRIFSPLKRKIRRLLHIKKPYIHVNKTNKIILGMVNKERKKLNISAVVFDESMYSHAKSWSAFMAHEEELSHSGIILENCAMVPSHGSPVTITKQMFYKWKGHPPHWKWMIDPSISKAGFAYTKNKNYAYGAYAFK